MAVKLTMSGTSSVEILDRVLDKGIVIDAEYHYALLGINVFDAHSVVASSDTYLRYAAPIVAVRSVRRPALRAEPAAVVSIRQRRRRKFVGARSYRS